MLTVCRELTKNNETAFVTEQMSGKAYEAAAEKLGDIINMIRVN